MSAPRALRTPLLPVLILLALVASGCRARVLHDLSERDALFIAHLLRGEDVDAQIRRGAQESYELAVPTRQRRDAEEALGRLPPLRAARLDDELWQQSGLLPSRDAERLWGLRRAAREVELTLASIPWVQDARVLPSHSDNAVDAEAAHVGVMLLTHRGLRDGEGHAIARLVAAAFNGVSDNDVTVVPVTILSPQQRRRVSRGPAETSEPRAEEAR